MTKQSINRLVGELTQIERPDVAHLQAALGVEFRQTEKDDPWTFYEFELAGGPFARGEFRHDKNGARALLGLWPDPAKPPAEKDIDLKPWGKISGIDVNPHIHPEGADAYIFNVGGVRVSFQFLHNSRGLRSIALEWGTAKKG